MPQVSRKSFPTIGITAQEMEGGGWLADQPHSSESGLGAQVSILQLGATACCCYDSPGMSCSFLVHVEICLCETRKLLGSARHPFIIGDHTVVELDGLFSEFVAAVLS